MLRIGSTLWAMAPYPLLDQLAQTGGKQHLSVYVWIHRYGFGQQDNWCRESVQTLATKCGMKPNHVRETLCWLLEADWIERLGRSGQASFYRVKADALASS